MDMNITEMIVSQGALMPNEKCLFFTKGDKKDSEYEDFYFNDLSSEDLRSERVIVAVTKKHLFLFKENSEIE